MKLAGLTMIAVALLVGAWYLGGRGGESARPEVEAAVEQEQPSAELVQPEEFPRDEAPERAAVEAAPKAEKPPAATPVEAVEPDPIDREETDFLTILVVDSFGTPIPGAKAASTGMRTVENPGDWVGWSGEGMQETTDAEGLARIEFPRWLAGHGGGWRSASKVCFTVSHPEYVAVDEQVSVNPLQEKATVVLEHGAFLILSGWIDDPAEKITDLETQLCYDVQTSKEDWIPLADGRPSNNRVQPGRHVLAIRHEREGTTYSSAPTVFELEPAEQKELHVQLLPPRILEGRLEARVPRPVVDGAVELSISFDSGVEGGILYRVYRTPVQADGGFRIESLPQGSIEIIGLCSGWSSALVPDSDPEKRGTNQMVPDNLEEPFVLRMEPTSSVSLLVLDANGKPLPGASVNMWPNVSWSVGFSNIFMDGSWNAKTDASGRALVANLPPRSREGLTIVHGKYDMPLATSPWGQDRRQTWVDLVPGETLELEITLEEKEQ